MGGKWPLRRSVENGKNEMIYGYPLPPFCIVPLYVLGAGVDSLAFAFL